MSTDAIRELVATQLGLITVPLYETVSVGVAAASARLRGFPNVADYPYLLPTLARAEMNSRLREQAPEGWKLGGNPRQMGNTTLISDRHNIELRLLKEHARFHPGGIPPAGLGRARQDWWDGPEMALMSARDLLPDTYDPKTGIRLLWLWDRAVEDDGERISVRVVHTVGAGRFGRAVPIDYSFEVRPGGEMFSRLHFAGEKQNELFFPNINQKDNDTDGLAQ
ncbi:MULTISPECIES: hypothetical protein [unclassified Dietzia]|uniref:hypothetical protein n=1 Tax=unclassified Dietzia TaxID=2617939 RepID=UPI0015FD4846|nr:MULTISPECIES: hypothetical protein [unclassified Dietzia]MBB1023340.1 hypothetical protein [Dietzia sp. DQ12-76]MBB1027529.1 hypothetical protein [Dietzia sp. DQ11-38-2]